MKDKISHINPEQLTDIEMLRQVVVLLLNRVEELDSELQESKQENGLLRDEINKLKGEQGKPVFKANKESKRRKDKDKKPRNKNNKKGGKKDKVEIDKEVICEVDKDKLPADAVFKGYDEHIQQDIEINRKNTLYKIAIYYSASEKKTYRALVPPCGKGMYGPGVKTLLNMLNRGCDTTQSRLKILFDSLGINISTGSINNYLLEPEQWVIEEQKEILRSGLTFGDYAQIDGTKSVERGVSKVTQIICGAYFTVFYTKKDKKRLSILEALQGMAGGLSVLKYGYNGKTEEMLVALNVSSGNRHKLEKIFGDKNKEEIFEWEGEKDAFEQQMREFAPKIMAKKNIYVRVMESFALSYYYMQDEFPVVEYLISDDAPEYRKLAKIIHGLCWIHDARFYKKLIPKIERHKEILSKVMAQYWDFYDSLLAYKEGSKQYQALQKELINQEFDNIFNQKTDYFQVNDCLQRTRQNKNKLLAVLNNPALPLHNNAAELGARRIVRKRDISLHSWSATGTLVRDAFMSVVETCLKLKVSPFKYIEDRTTGKNSMPALSSLIYQFSV